MKQGHSKNFAFENSLPAAGELLELPERKRIVISDHARKRISRCGLIEEEIVAAVRDPDEVVEGHRGCKVARRFKGRHIIRVVYDEDDSLLGVTAYPSRRERYAKE